jgi:hypothetical protein
MSQTFTVSGNWREAGSIIQDLEEFCERIRISLRERMAKLMASGTILRVGNRNLVAVEAKREVL